MSVGNVCDDDSGLDLPEQPAVENLLCLYRFPFIFEYPLHPVEGAVESFVRSLVFPETEIGLAVFDGIEHIVYFPPGLYGEINSGGSGGEQHRAGSYEDVHDQSKARTGVRYCIFSVCCTVWDGLCRVP